MITTFENRYVLKKYVIVLRPIFDTKYRGEIQVEIYMWALYHELVIFQQSRNCFRYVPENDIKGNILGCNLSQAIRNFLENKTMVLGNVVTQIPITHDAGGDPTK